MAQYYSLNFFYITIGVLLLVILLANRYWGTVIILFAQPFYIGHFRGPGANPRR